MNPTTSLGLPPIRGTLIKTEIQSAIQGITRPVGIYLPPSYHHEPERRYPVIYIHYGQRIFDSKRPGDNTWQIHRLVERLLDATQMQEVIIVGIDATRGGVASDYFHYGAYLEGAPAEGLAFEGFVLRELLPYVNATYRTLRDLESTAMFGASAAGTFTYNLSIRNPGIFGKLGIFSPIARRANGDAWFFASKWEKPDAMVWVDVGDAEGYWTPHARFVVDGLLAAGCKPDEELYYHLHPNSAHLDEFWGAHVHMPLRLFFGDIGRPVSVELLGGELVGVGQALATNPIVHYDSGVSLTKLSGEYRVEDPRVLRAEPDGHLIGLSEGTTQVTLHAHGLSASRRYRVVRDLPDHVQVRLRAHVPEEMPDKARIYVGTLPLDRVAPTIYEGEHRLERGYAEMGQFAWDMHKVELLRDGSPAPYRLIRADEDKEIEFVIERWAGR